MAIGIIVGLIYFALWIDRDKAPNTSPGVTTEAACLARILKSWMCSLYTD